MSQSKEYKRGYSKGYITGCRRSDAEIASVKEDARLVAIRAEQAEIAAGIGHCEDCAHWLRGGGGPSSSSCAWGKCKAPKGVGTPWCCAILHDESHEDIVTTPRFGCVLFLKN